MEMPVFVDKKKDIGMKERIEALMAEIEALSCKSEQEIEEARVRLLGKKGSVTALFEEFTEPEAAPAE